MTKSTRRARPRTCLDPARQAAYDALRAVDLCDAYLNLTLSRLFTERRVDARDAAFATELANGTARLQGSYDAIIDPLVSAGAASVQPEVRTALRLGAHQLLSMRVPAHAAVGTSAELVREAVGERPVRLVNAVLRRLEGRSLDEWLSLCAPPLDADPVGHLAVRYSHPAWIVSAFLDVLGNVDELVALLEADNVAPAVTLAVRPGLMSVDELEAEALSASTQRPEEVGGSAGKSWRVGGKGLAGRGVERGRWSPYAVVLNGGNPGALIAVRSGRAGVQDEGSQLAALALARVELSGGDSRWLDLCAGPGGKAALLTGLARARGATLIAAEHQPHRARLVRQALRANGGVPPVAVADGRLPAWRDGAFDRVLVDAPCTGLGALRRRPESRWRRQPADLDALVPLQQALLGAAIDSTRTGGVVAYVTCSPHLAETRGVVDAVLSSRRDVAEEDARATLPEVPDPGAGPHLQLWPHRHGTDAMFVSLLRRRSPDAC